MSEMLLVFFLRLGGEEVISAECYLLLSEVGELHSCAGGQSRAISSFRKETFPEAGKHQPHRQYHAILRLCLSKIEREN